MARLINPAQSAFIPGRTISDNVLLSHDLVGGFHLNKGTPKMCLKIDLSKAFDFVRWEFLQAALLAMNFPSTLVGWIMSCVTRPAFSVLINGAPCGYFNSNRV